MLNPGTQAPKITYLEHDHRWVLDFAFASRPTSFVGGAILIPAGYETDLASVPRVLWSIDAPFELSESGAITHDWLYQHGGRVSVQMDNDIGPTAREFTRPEADQCFLDYMKADGVPWLKRITAYHAVRWFGGSSWQAVK